MLERSEAGYLANIGDPVIVASAQDVDWDDAADVVVIGFGGAGVAAAIESLDQGLGVICLDRFAGGGSTRLSGGVTYAGGTRFQAEAGFEDSPENMYAYLSGEPNAVSPQTLKTFCETSNENLEWLASLGVPYSSKAYLGKTSYPPEGSFLYYTANEALPAAQLNASAAPRGHRAVGKGFTGRVHFDALRKAAEQRGARLYPHSPVRQLVKDGDGRVLGVVASVIPDSEWKKHDAFFGQIKPVIPFRQKKYLQAAQQCADWEQSFPERRFIRARAGVVISAGGFLFNHAMMKRHNPHFEPFYMNLIPVSCMGDDGSGIELGRSAGGAIGLMDSLCLTRVIAPPAELSTAALVNMEGQRFIAEDAYSGFVGSAILNQGGRAWLIIDSRAFWKAFKACVFPKKGLRLLTLPNLLNIALGGTKRASSISALAQKIGVPAAALGKTIDEYNRCANDAAPDPIGKNPDNIAPVQNAPFYAIDMNMAKPFSMTLAFTLGGLRVNEDTGNVIDEDGAPIPGLYAAGRAAIGLCSKAYFSGMSLADTVFSGRRAARDLRRMMNAA